ncbi:hypothetical protein APTSU1_000439600 [Apodemus speciosus]|uniref:Uncharacterized protein n=1 Tax=Apodemus speciosus TaxID=105296 RepID=A0ABQ0EQU7_APOSI
MAPVQGRQTLGRAWIWEFAFMAWCAVQSELQQAQA